MKRELDMSPEAIARRKKGGYASKRPKDIDPRILETIPGSTREQAKILGVNTRTVTRYRAALREIRAAEQEANR